MLNNLKHVDWNFADYYGSRQFPSDINTLHWYPAIFVPHIPAILIQILSNEGDLVLDPFSGAGSTLIEASRLRRRFVGVDLNPYAVNIALAKLIALSKGGEGWSESTKVTFKSIIPIDNANKVCNVEGIDPEVFDWFEENTIAELLAIRSYITKLEDSSYRLINQVIFSSILNKCCSQRDHYTYITDKCLPKQMIYRPAIKYYHEQIELVRSAIYEAKKQFYRVYGYEWFPMDDGIIKCDDARNLEWIKDNSIDIVVTSPPYLGVNDYVRSMRLTGLFFPEEGAEVAIRNEIGARRKRQRKKAYDEYLLEMDLVLTEIARVLKPTGFCSLILGQGKGQVNKNNVVSELVNTLKSKHKFHVFFEAQRKIKFRRIQVIGVEIEKIIILKR